MKIISSLLMVLLCCCGNTHASEFQFNMDHLRADWEQIDIECEDLPIDACGYFFELIDNDNVSLDISKVSVLDLETTLEAYLQQIVDYFAGSASFIPALSDGAEEYYADRKDDLISIEKVLMGDIEWIQIVESGYVSDDEMTFFYKACVYTTLLDGKIYTLSFTTQPEFYDDHESLFNDTARAILSH